MPIKDSASAASLAASFSQSQSTVEPESSFASSSTMLAESFPGNAPVGNTSAEKKVMSASSRVSIVTFYKFVTLEDYVDLKQPLLDFCRQQKVKGTILLAKEGMNATIAGPETGVGKVLAYLRHDPRLADLEHKVSFAGDYPFYRMKVKLKREIVTMGIPDIRPAVQTGAYVPAKQWNALIQDDQVLLVDTRNDYEVDLGTFSGAVAFPMKSFRAFPAYKDAIINLMHQQGKSKLAMFCTGGIRCEKSTAFMQAYVDQVYHLQGGILKYLEEIPQQQSLWQGDCFVFDNRVTVNKQLEQGSYQQCFACRHPITAEDMAGPDYQRGICCPYCCKHISSKTLARVTERQKQMDLARQRKMQHLGMPLSEAKKISHKNKHAHKKKDHVKKYRISSRSPHHLPDSGMQEILV